VQKHISRGAAIAFVLEAWLVDGKEWHSPGPPD